MKKALVLLLALSMLAGCGRGSTPSEPEEPALSLPETRPAVRISAPAVVTEGRPPTTDYDLPPSLAATQKDPRYGIEDWIRGGTVGLMAEVPEADAAFYAAPYQANGDNSVLLRWGSSLAEFDWDFLTPRTVLPRMDCFDVDGDGEDELTVTCYIGSGTGVSIEELHIVEKNPDETLTDHALPEDLWQHTVSSELRLDHVGGRYFLSLGRELVELIPDPQLQKRDMGPSTGWIANFRFLPDESAILLEGAVVLWHYAYYVAGYTADVHYENGIFTLQDFHLYSYDQ